MNGSPPNYRLERVEEANGKMFAYRYKGEDPLEPDHRLCAPCWNGDKLTVVLHERKNEDKKPDLWCPRCQWSAIFR